MPIEVLRPNGKRERYDANAADVSANGDLLLSRVTVRGAGLAGPGQTIEREPVKIIRRGLWDEVNPVEQGEADVVKIGAPPALAAR